MDPNTFYQLIVAAFSPRRWFEEDKAGKSYDVDLEGKLIEIDIFEKSACARPKKNASLSEFAREFIRLNPETPMHYNSDAITLGNISTNTLLSIDQTCVDNPNVVILVHRLFEEEAIRESKAVCQYIKVKRENGDRPMRVSDVEIGFCGETYIRILLS